MLPRFPFACLPGVAALAFGVDSEASEYAVLTGEVPPVLRTAPAARGAVIFEPLEVQYFIRFLRSSPGRETLPICVLASADVSGEEEEPAFAEK